jgi:hypothetical protein
MLVALHGDRRLIRRRRRHMANDRDRASDADRANERDRADDRDASEGAPGTGREHDMTNTSYGATEREQTRDVRSRNPRGDANVADGGVSEVLERNSDSPAD